MASAGQADADRNAAPGAGAFGGENPYAAPAAPVAAVDGRDAFRPRRWYLLAGAVTLGFLGTMCAALGVAALVRTLRPAAAVTPAALGAVFLYLAAVLVFQWRARRRAVVRPCREGVQVRLIGAPPPGPSRWPRALRGLAPGRAFRVTAYRIPWSGLVDARAESRGLAPTLVLAGRPPGAADPVAFRFPDVEFSAHPAVAAAALLGLRVGLGSRDDLPEWDEG